MKYLKRLIKMGKSTVEGLIKNVQNRFAESKQGDNDVSDISEPSTNDLKENLTSEKSLDCLSDEKFINTKKEDNNEESSEEQLTKDIIIKTSLNYDKKYLIDDYVTNGQIILCISSGKLIKDTTIDELSLSTRAYNALYRQYKKYVFPDHKVLMVSDVLNLTQEQLIKVKNIGTLTADEIIHKISSYLQDKNNILYEENIADKNNIENKNIFDNLELLRNTENKKTIIENNIDMKKE